MQDVRKGTPSPLVIAAAAAARPLAGLTQAATLAWDAELIVRGSAGACPAVFGRSSGELRGKALGEWFERSESFKDALHYGMTRPVRLRDGTVVRLEAGPCPGGAVAIVRKQSSDELDLTRMVSALGHELRNAFASVMLAVQSLKRQGEVESERGRRRLVLAERELRRIECVLRGLQEVGRSPVAKLVEIQPEHLIEDAIVSLGPDPGGERVVVEATGGTGELASFDAARVRLALEEMIRHGIRSLPSGGVVQVGAERSVGELALVVTATGPDVVQPALAEGGDFSTDLGLAVVDGVARAHGGHTEMHRVATGCRLTLVLPQRAVGS